MSDNCALGMRVVVPHFILDLGNEPIELALFEDLWMVRGLFKDADGAAISVLQRGIYRSPNDEVRLERLGLSTGNDG